jgi:hypothetical protein
LNTPFLHPKGDVPLYLPLVDYDQSGQNSIFEGSPVEDIAILESEVQSDNVRMAVAASIIIGLIVIAAVVTMWNRRSLDKQTVEALPVELERDLQVS